MGSPRRSESPELLDELEQRVVEILGMPEPEQGAAFAQLRSQHPDQAKLLRHWEAAAHAIATEHETVAGYAIESVRGEGGMGTVYLAEQLEPVRRRVALKVVKLGMDTKQILARFELERRTLAMMNHDAIAKVYDAGVTERGQPYFAMEYVPGLPLTTYCDRYGLTVRERIELFQEVCRGVQHAHQNGVIHRDLKPGNLLVVNDGKRPKPKIIDFGLARAMNPGIATTALRTEHGEFVGTPEYMSPEQACLGGPPVDTRTDIYALGVTLYEVLIGRLPHSSAELRGGAKTDLVATLQGTEPERPSKRTRVRVLARELRGDLDWIVLKAMAKEPDRRYGSASELARDLGRYLAHQPVEAGPPSTWYRARKLVRRHRGRFAAAATVFLALVGGTIGTAIGLVRATEQTRIANDRAREIARQRDEIRTEAETAEQVTDFVVGLFNVSNPSEARGNSITAREILDRSAARIEELKDPKVRGRLLRTMGDVYRNLGLYDAAAPLLARALAIQRRTLGDDDRDTLRTIDALGKLVWDREDSAAAARHHREALEARRRLFGDDDRETLSSMNNYGLALRDLGELEEAERWLRRSLAGRRRTLGNEHRETLVSVGNMAQMFMKLGKSEEAEALLREALETRRRVLGDDHPDTLISINDLGTFHYNGKRYAAAEARYREALTRNRKVRGDDHRETLTTFVNLACALMRQGKLDEAEPYCRAGLDGFRRNQGETASPTRWASMVAGALAKLQARAAGKKRGK